MLRRFKGTFNRVPNGNFLNLSKSRENFPDAWFEVGGNSQSSWTFKQKSVEISVMEIGNTTAIRAGIIQIPEASLDVRNDKEWLITILAKGDSPKLQAYLRIYPMHSNRDVYKPWEYCYQLGVEQQRIKQVISTPPEVDFIRLEFGILGSGRLSIYKVVAYPLSPNLMKRRVKKPIPKICRLDFIQSIGEIIKPIQLATPIPLEVPVNVQANVSADVRNLTPNRDKVQIFGSSQVPIATSVYGRLQVETSGHGFHESLEDVTASNSISTSIIRDVSMLTCCSFAVYNFGNELAHVQMELSPDGIHWTEEGPQKEVGSGKLVILSPETFLRYIRLTYRAESLTPLRIWVQAQT